MTTNFGPPDLLDTRGVEAFCSECGVVQSGTLHPASYIGWRRAQEQVVIVHCTDCGAVTRHYGNVRIWHTGKMSVIRDDDE